MTYRCLKIKMSPGGNHHSHIVEISGIEVTTGGPVRGTRLQWVNTVKTGYTCYVQDIYGNRADLRVNHIGATEYVQTYADGKWTDNLLALPRY